jgi:hypothetical protein
MYDPRILLGRRLKSPECITLLAEFDLKIIYDIDLLREGTADVYWIRDPAHGCTWCANEHQEITVAFVQLRAEGVEQAFPWPLTGITVAGEGLAGWGAPSAAGAFPGSRWVRYDRADLTTHVEWDAAGLIKATFSLPKA